MRHLPKTLPIGLLFFATLSPFPVEAADCAYTDTKGTIHNTCTYTIRLVIERRFMVQSGLNSIEHSVIEEKNLSPKETWRPAGTGFTIVREEPLDRRK